MRIEDTPVRTAGTLGTAPGRGRLTGRRVLVMGSGQEDGGSPDGPPEPGNGRAISQLLAREGAAVACADLDPGRAAETAQLIERAGGRAVPIGGDATDRPGYAPSWPPLSPSSTASTAWCSTSAPPAVRRSRRPNSATSTMSGGSTS